MQHGAAFHPSLYCLYRQKKIFRQKNTLIFKSMNPTPLDMYNGLSKKYFITPEGRIHLHTKG